MFSFAEKDITSPNFNSNNIIEIRDLSFFRGGQVIYQNLNIDVPRGKITAIMGPSGTGKTTLLKLIGGELLPNQGSIAFDGQYVNLANNDQLFQLRKKMGMLFQTATLFTDMTCYENIALPLLEHTNLDENLIYQLVMMKLEAVGLRGVNSLYPSELSGGMQRRIALARSIALDPSLIMYDEPFAGQDPISLAKIMQVIDKLNRSTNMTSIIVSHDVNEVLNISDWCYILYAGKTIAKGTPQDILKSEDPYVKQFLNADAEGPISFHKPANEYIPELFKYIV